jgi:hypothetical protein
MYMLIPNKYYIASVQPLWHRAEGQTARSMAFSHPSQLADRGLVTPGVPLDWPLASTGLATSRIPYCHQPRHSRLSQPKNDIHLKWRCIYNESQSAVIMMPSIRTSRKSTYSPAPVPLRSKCRSDYLDVTCPVRNFLS